MNPVLKNIRKIAVFRVLQLGDLLCAVPAIRALRFAYPKAEITLLGMPWSRSFVQRFSNYFNRFIHFPGYPGLPEQHGDPEALEVFLRNIRKEQFDLLLQMQGNGTIVNPLMFEFGAKNVAGFYNSKSFVDSPLFIEYPDKGYEFERHLLLMENLGIVSQGDSLEFPLNRKDQEDFENLRLRVSNYICIHPGARSKQRQWPPRHFAALADYWMERGFNVIITGIKEEAGITASVIKNMRHVPLDLTGKTSLGALAVLIKNASALISNCTGVSHIADALKTPSVIISMEEEAKRWAPKDTTIHRSVNWLSSPDFERVLLESCLLIAPKRYRFAR